MPSVLILCGGLAFVPLVLLAILWLRHLSRENEALRQRVRGLSEALRALEVDVSRCAERSDGARCIRDRGHDGPHELGADVEPWPATRFRRVKRLHRAQ